MKPESLSFYVFVYGTLKPGERNFHYCDGYVESETLAYVRGVLYELPFGYPAMTRGNRKVKGVLLKISNPAILMNLDSLEGYDPQRTSGANEYERHLVKVYSLEDRFIVEAWTYFMNLAKIEQYQGTLIESNWWTS